jgi:non-specific serine/threonine protein kinase
LAIELAAARLRTHSIDALLAAMDAMLATLTEGERDRPARQQAMRATIAVSVDALTEAEREAFRAFAVFGGGASADAIAAVCAPKADELDSLADKSLLRRTAERFTMLEPIRQFAEERLRNDTPGEFAQRVAAHAHFFLELAERLEPDLVTARQRDALDQLSTEHANLLLAIERGEGDTPLRIAAALTRFWVIRGFPHEGRRVLALVLAAYPNAAPELRARARAGAGQLALLQDDLAAAKRELRTVLGDAIRAEMGSAHNLLAEVARREGNLEEAETHLAAALTVDDDRVFASTRNGQGTVAIARGDFASAIGLLREAAAVSKRTGDLQTWIRSVGNLGFALMSTGEIDDAAAAFESSLALARQMGNRGAEAAALQNLAWAAQAADGFTFKPKSSNLLTAREYLLAAVGIFEDLGYRRELAHALMAVPAVTEDRDEGFRALARAEGMFRTLGDSQGMASVAEQRRAFLEECD